MIRGIDAGKEFAKPLVSEALRMRQAIFIEGEAGKNVVLDVIKEEGFIVEYLTDEMIARRVPGFGNLRIIFGRRDHLAMLVSNAERTQSCYVFTCMQFASTVGGPQSAHRSGNFAMPFFHDWIRAFLIFANAPRHHIFPPYTTIEESLLNSFLFKVGAAKITAMPSAKGKFWELRIMATKPPDVTLVDMVIYKELSAKSRARNDRYYKRKRDEAQGRADR